MSEPDPGEPNGLLGEAAAWFARMRAPDAEESREAFEQWLSRGALHRAAYNRAAEIFALGKILADDAEPPAAQEWRPRVAIAAGAGGLLVVLLAGLLLWRLSAVRPTSASGRLERVLVAELVAGSEKSSFHLADGSVVALQRGSRVSVDLNGPMRRLSLERGTARFYVAHDGRPFLVYAGGGYVAARGTIFDVGLAGNRQVVVRLIEGVVDVRSPAAANPKARAPEVRRLRAGETLSFAAMGTAASDRHGVSPGAGADGVAQAHDFASISLMDLVALANQHASRPIRFAAPATGNLRVSGSFRIDDTDVLAQRLAALFDLAIDTSQPDEILLRPK